MKIKAFDTANLKLLRAELEPLLDELGQKYGIVLTIGRIGYSPSNFKASLEGAVLSEDGTAETREAQDFKAMAEFYGLKPEYLGKEFVSNNKRFRVSGLKPRSPKYPVLAVDVVSGTVYKFPADTVKRKLEAAA